MMAWLALLTLTAGFGWWLHHEFTRPSSPDERALLAVGGDPQLRAWQKRGNR